MSNKHAAIMACPMQCMAENRTENNFDMSDIRYLSKFKTLLLHIMYKKMILSSLIPSIICAYLTNH